MKRKELQTGQRKHAGEAGSPGEAAEIHSAGGTIGKKTTIKH